MQPSDSLLTREAVAHLRHELRTPINQIVGYCEMMLEDADAPGWSGRRPPLTDALKAVREATTLIDASLPTSLESMTSDSITDLYTSLRRPQAHIIAAMDALLREAGEGAEATFIADVCRVRDAAERLLPTDRPREAPTALFVAPAMMAVPTTPSTHFGGRSARILVVDDVAENRSVLQRRLEREGHAVTCASGGREAITIVGRSSFDIILLDVMMPDIDGYETLDTLKREESTRDIPVIMISALDDIVSIVRCIERGAADYLPKPFDPVLLRARINAALEYKAIRDHERALLRDVMRIAAAATEVERGTYGVSLSEVAKRSDPVGTLARVFDRMAAGVRDREKRLREQVDKLREEISGIAEVPADADSPGGALMTSGDLLADRYCIDRLVGAGGMGVVYLAKDTELGEPVAVKVIRSEQLAAEDQAMERFRNEIRLARRLSHRNIVRTHDFGRDGAAHFVTMEYVEGTTLRSVLDRRGRLGIPASLAVVRQLAEALECAHEAGVIHRDIKPQNMLLDADGLLKVMDFGIARLVEGANGITQSGLIVGTPTYMSPEQLLDEELDARSDLYAAGVVLYECLRGVPPYEARTPMALIAHVLRGAAPPPSERVAEIPEALSSLVMRLLARERAERIESAAMLREVLGLLPA